MSLGVFSIVQICIITYFLIIFNHSFRCALVGDVMQFCLFYDLIIQIQVFAMKDKI